MPRRVFCLVGLPFDALSMEETERLIRQGAASRQTRILSTPNLNWVATASRDRAFRDSVLASDCSVVDGMPLVWLARLLGLPCRERVSGSDLMERLHASTHPLRVYFFGGLGDVADRAVRALRHRPSGLIPAGSCNPGKGSVMDMSTTVIIDDINQASPDFLVVSLGALKGQAWIMHNRSALQVPWVSHLGAVVNFFAGEVRRAPAWVAASGLEWLWRIYQEPALWRRYAADAVTVLKLLLFRLLPYLVLQWFARPHEHLPAEHSIETLSDGAYRLHLRGDWRDERALSLGALMAHALESARRVEVDLSGVTHLANGAVAQLMVARGRAQVLGLHLSFEAGSRRAVRILKLNCAEYLLIPD
jgi:N-acetylglucosaminyldiphosphoundecaprenol N-acetyl-beta-D-mannosaminyltransferase